MLQLQQKPAIIFKILSIFHKINKPAISTKVFSPRTQEKYCTEKYFPLKCSLFLLYSYICVQIISFTETVSSLFSDNFYMGETMFKNMASYVLRTSSLQLKHVPPGHSTRGGCKSSFFNKFIEAIHQKSSSLPEGCYRKL